MAKEYKYYSQENRKPLGYGLFYHCFGSHKNVDDFMFVFHSIGCGEMKHLEGNEKYDKILSIYSFWREKEYISKKQINWVHTLMSELGEL